MDGPVTVKAGKVNGVKTTVSFRENILDDPYKNYISSCSLFFNDGVNTEKYVDPLTAVATDGGPEGYDLIEYNYYFYGNDTEGNINYSQYDYFAPFLSVNTNTPSLYGLNGTLSEKYFVYDDSTRTISVSENFIEILDSVYALTTLKVNDTVLGKFDAEHRSYTLDKKSYEYISDWNGKTIEYYDFIDYYLDSDFDKQVYISGKYISEEEFVSNFTSVQEGTDWDKTGLLSIKIGTESDDDLYATSATVKFENPFSVDDNNEQKFIYILNDTYTLSFTLSGIDGLNVGSTMKITIDGNIYKYECESVQTGDDVYTLEWVGENPSNPDISLNDFSYDNNRWEISGMPVQYIPTAIEFYQAP